CDLKTYSLAELKDRKVSDDGKAAALGTDARRSSRNGGDETELTFVNRTGGEVELFWLDTSGQRRTYGKLAVGENKREHTYVWHVWEVLSGDGTSLGRVEAEDAPRTVVIDGRPRPDGQSEGRRDGSDGTRSVPATSRDRSPDGKWTATI